MKDRATMTSVEIQGRLGYQNRTDATKWLHRKGVRPVSRNLDASGNYDAAEVEAALARRPGQGARTDELKQHATDSTHGEYQRLDAELSRQKDLATVRSWLAREHDRVDALFELLDELIRNSPAYVAVDTSEEATAREFEARKQRKRVSESALEIAEQRASDGRDGMGRWLGQ